MSKNPSDIEPVDVSLSEGFVTGDPQSIPLSWKEDDHQCKADTPYGKIVLSAPGSGRNPCVWLEVPWRENWVLTCDDMAAGRKKAEQLYHGHLMSGLPWVENLDGAEVETPQGKIRITWREEWTAKKVAIKAPWRIEWMMFDLDLDGAKQKALDLYLQHLGYEPRKPTADVSFDQRKVRKLDWVTRDGSYAMALSQFGRIEVYCPDPRGRSSISLPWKKNMQTKGENLDEAMAAAQEFFEEHLRLRLNELLADIVPNQPITSLRPISAKMDTMSGRAHTFISDIEEGRIPICKQSPVANQDVLALAAVYMDNGWISARRMASAMDTDFDTLNSSFMKANISYQINL